MFLFVHKQIRTKTVRSLALDSFVVLSMSLQSGNPNGNILALVSGSDRLRIFDVRKNNSKLNFIKTLFIYPVFN